MAINAIRKQQNQILSAETIQFTFLSVQHHIHLDTCKWCVTCGLYKKKIVSSMNSLFFFYRIEIWILVNKDSFNRVWEETCLSNRKSVLCNEYEIWQNRTNSVVSQWQLLLWRAEGKCYVYNGLYVLSVHNIGKNKSVYERRKHTKEEVPKKNVTHVYWLKES